MCTRVEVELGKNICKKTGKDEMETFPFFPSSSSVLRAKVSSADGTDPYQFLLSL